MIKFKFLFIFFLLSYSISHAQEMVNSQDYSSMLRDLLSHSVPEIGVDEAATQTTEVVFLDAREKKEYKTSHLKDAIYVGYDRFKMSKVKDIPKDQKIIVYCSVGYRSEKIAERLIAVGYTDVSNMYGGIFEWKNQNLEVYNKTGKTQEVHAYDKAWGTWLTNGIKKY